MDDSNILQADATVIAGLLILLTVAYNLAPRSPSEYVGFFALATVRSLSRLIIGIVLFFSASAILVTLGNISSSYTIPLYHYSIPSYHYTIYLGSYTIIPVLWGKWTMIFGFGVLAVGISWLLLSKATRSFEYTQRGKDKTGDH